MLHLIAVWAAVTWAAGRLLHPLVRPLFPGLPDGGLAAGRILWLMVSALLLLWMATLRLAPLSVAPLIVLVVPVVAYVVCLRRPGAKAAWQAWQNTHRRHLLASDALLLLAFGAFVLLRLRHPGINDLEKPMDAALMAGLARTDYLPMMDPWFAGTPFTNYYYFGHLMGSLPMRSLFTSPAYGYNLVLPLFSALFLGALWSLCHALTGSARRGLLAAIAVGLAGHYEPLRQWLHPLPTAGNSFLGVDWWSTTRVLPGFEPGQEPSATPGWPWFTLDRHQFHSISEYPGFTLTIGDAHAHFFALALGALLLCLVHGLFALPHGDQRPQRYVLLLLSGATLAAVWMTNTWDLPLYALLVVAAALWTLPGGRWWRLAKRQVASRGDLVDALAAVAGSRTKRRRGRKVKGTPLRGSPAVVTAPDSGADVGPDAGADPALGLQVLGAVLPLPLAWLLSWPYRRTFEQQISGVVREIVSHPLLPFLLLWGFFIGLWLAGIYSGGTRPLRWIVGILALLLASGLMMLVPAASLLVTGTVLALTLFVLWREWVNPSQSALPEQTLVWLLGALGLLAVLIPMLGYIQGVFGGPLRHQDTVFKFGLQGWLLLGTGTITAWLSRPGRWRPAALAALLGVPILCTTAVVWVRAVRDVDARAMWTLNGAEHLPPGEQQAIDWLRRQARAGDTVLEAVGVTPEGAPGGDFDSSVARISALSGVPTPLGWPGHVRSWGAPNEEIEHRARLAATVYAWENPAAARAALRRLGVRWIFVGEAERRRYDPQGLERLEKELPVAYEDRDALILKAQP